MDCKIRVAELPQDDKDEVMIAFVEPFKKNENKVFSLKKIVLYDLLTKLMKENT